MNFRIVFTAFIFCLAIPAIGNAQYAIHGKVMGANGKAIAGASVYLLAKSDSALIKVTQTNKEGLYNLTTDTIVSALLKAAAANYITQTKNVDFEKATVLDFTLQAETTLSEVAVTTRKAVIEEKVDRTLFNVENSITATGGDALEALKKAPGVLVVHNQITIVGKDAVSVMINGRLQQLSGDDLIQLLRSIPASNLSKIEVITTPPAKYDAEGNAGIVNLVTKKNTKLGLRGSATASYNQNTYGSPSLSASLNYRQGNLNAYCNANTGVWAWQYNSHTTTYYPGQVWQQDVWQGSFNKYARVQTGADYALTKTTTIGFSYTKGTGTIENDEHITATSVSSSHVIDSIVRTTGVEHLNYTGCNTLSLNYEWKIDTTGKKLNIDADYYTQSIGKDRLYNITDQLASGATTPYGSDNHMYGGPSITIKSVKADVEWPLKIVNLSFGGKAASVTNNSNSFYETMQGAAYIADPMLSDMFAYTEQTQAVYVSAHKVAGRFEVQAGLRGEHTQTRGTLLTTGQVDEHDYAKLFPTAYLQYKLKEGHTININYSRRIKRPGYSQLDPFKAYYTSTSYTQGNPNLQPSFSNNIEIGYRYRSLFNCKVYAQQTNQYWDRIFSIDSAAGTSSITRANIGTAYYYGLHASLSLAPANWWEFNGSVNGEYASFKLDYYSNTTLSGPNATINIDNSFFLNDRKTFSAELNGYYFSPRQKDYKRWDDMSCINVGFKWLLLNKDLILVLNFDDIMAKTYWLQTNLANGTREYSYDDERAVRLSATYKFGNKNVKARRERNTSTEEIQRAN